MEFDPEIFIGLGECLALGVLVFPLHLFTMRSPCCSFHFPLNFVVWLPVILGSESALWFVAVAWLF